jgi:selenocysteine insertion sequence-binding protein 2
MFNALSISTQTKQQNSQNKTNKSSIKSINSANPLDSKPAPKRGKEREQPKPRKPTKLKRIINKELEENQKQRQQFHSKIKQSNEKDPQSEPETSCINVFHESTSASCTDESNNETDDDDDEILDHEPTSQLQTPYSHQMPESNIKQQIHDAGFREYCSQLIDRQLDELCIQLLLTLKRFQDRKKQQFQSNPERARCKRRFVHGIREVTKHLRLQRLKCVLIAPDCQSIESQGGLNDALEKIINLCKEQNIPYIFTLNRQKLGRCLNKISRISTIGIFDYSGVDQIYKQIVEITNENQRAYKQILDHDQTTTTSHGLNSKEFYKILHRTFQQQQQKHQIVNTIPNESLSKILPKVPAHYAHSRQTSDTSTIYIDPQLINSIKKQHTRASSGTFDIGVKKNHQRTLSDGATAIDDTSIQMKHHLKTHSRTPSGCSAISQIEQQDYFEQSKNILMINNNDEISIDNEENRLKSINEDTEESSANIKRKNVEKWINDN